MEYPHMYTCIWKLIVLKVFNFSEVLIEQQNECTGIIPTWTTYFNSIECR